MKVETPANEHQNEQLGVTYEELSLLCLHFCSNMRLQTQKEGFVSALMYVLELSTTEVQKL